MKYSNSSKEIIVSIIIVSIIIISVIIFLSYKYIKDNTYECLSYFSYIFKSNEEKKIINEKNPFKEKNKHVCYQQATNDREKELILELLEKLYEVSNEKDLDIIICAGNLLGYLRNKNFIEWDDDFDTAINYKDIDKLKIVLDTLKERYGIESNYESYKAYEFYKKNIIKIHFAPSSDKTITYFNPTPFPLPGIAWPFIDIFVDPEPLDTAVINSIVCRLDETDYPLKTVNFKGVDIKLPNRDFTDFDDKNLKNVCFDSGFRHKYHQYIEERCDVRDC